MSDATQGGQEPDFETPRDDQGEQQAAPAPANEAPAQQVNVDVQQAPAPTDTADEPPVNEGE